MFSKVPCAYRQYIPQYTFKTFTLKSHSSNSDTHTHEHKTLSTQASQADTRTRC